jgi:1,4-dihydroxy-2-naphthoate octaprenyltransferase
VLQQFRTQLHTRTPWWKLAWKAIRPFAFPATLAPVLLGSLLAPTLDWMRFVLTLLGTMLAHAGVNVISDYMDWRRGADTWRVLGSSRVLVDGLMEPSSHLRLGIGLMVLAALIGVWLVSLSGPAIWALMAAGAALGIFYTVPPIGLKYRALGDIAVFLAFGPLMALGAYYVQTSQLSWMPVWLSLPIGLLTIAILHGNNYRDIAEDRAAGYHTVASLLGPRGSAYYYVVLLAGAYLSVALFVALQWLPVWSLAVFLTARWRCAILPLRSTMRGLPLASWTCSQHSSTCSSRWRWWRASSLSGCCTDARGAIAAGFPFGGLVLATAWWFVLFSPWTAPVVRFWWGMLFATGSLLAYSAWLLRRQWHTVLQLNWRNVLLGVTSAIVLYGIFWLGHTVLLLLAPESRDAIAAVYQRRQEAPPWLLALLLGLWIGTG